MELEFALERILDALDRPLRLSVCDVRAGLLLKNEVMALWKATRFDSRVDDSRYLRGSGLISRGVDFRLVDVPRDWRGKT